MPECNLYRGFCRDIGILNPFIPETCSECIWKHSCEADMRHPDGVWDPVEYPEFFGWRLEHLTETQKKELMEPGSDMMIITPDCLDEFYPEPDPTGMTYRCNRCLSTDIDWKPEDIICKSCGWSEPLHDYPVARRY